MNVAELSEKVASHTGISKSAARAAVTAVFDTMAEALINGEEVRAIGFGKFIVRTNAARTARDPHSGKNVEVPERKSVRFRQYVSMRERLNA
jgi:DNA-binding protein HU-beta